jgi:hypothetical protein
MTMKNNGNLEVEFFTWLKTFLNDKGLQFSQCGFKTGDGLGARHDLDLVSGYWKEPNYSANKPPRWLYRIIPELGGLRAENPAGGAFNLGAINTAQEDKAGVIFRLVPLIQQAPGDFVQENSFEVHALFVFHGATPKGSSAEAINFDPATGAMRFKGEVFNYIGCGLLGLKPRNTELKIMENGAERTITYGDVITALSADIRAAPAGVAASAMPIYDLTQQGDLDALKKMVSDAWVAAGPVKPQAVVAAVGDEDEKDDDEIIPPASCDCPDNRQAPSHPRSGPDRRFAAAAGFLQANARPFPHQVGADRGLGRGGRHRRFAGFRDQPGLIQPQSHGALPRPLRHRHHRPRAGVGMKITHEFCPGDRYTYDFGFCSYEKGWAQVDTAQDASYFGTWANPTRLMIFSYCEGDTTLKEAASREEFAAELREIDAWNRAHGYGPARIDPGFDPAMKAAFEGLGLADILH